MNNTDVILCKRCGDRVYKIRRILKTVKGVQRHVPNLEGLTPPVKLLIYECHGCGAEAKTLVPMNLGQPQTSSGS